MRMFELLPRPLGSIFRKLTRLACNSRRRRNRLHAARRRCGGRHRHPVRQARRRGKARLREVNDMECACCFLIALSLAVDVRADAQELEGRGRCVRPLVRPRIGLGPLQPRLGHRNRLRDRRAGREVRRGEDREPPVLRQEKPPEQRHHQGARPHRLRAGRDGAEEAALPLLAPVERHALQRHQSAARIPPHRRLIRSGKEQGLHQRRPGEVRVARGRPHRRTGPLTAPPAYLTHFLFLSEASVKRLHHGAKGSNTMV